MRVCNSLQLAQYARQNRSRLTESEALLWSALKNRQLGVQFRRQVPLVGRYIVDFCAPGARLVVEVDGGYHARRCGADARRDAKLCSLGFRVLRLPVALVLRDLPAAVALVRVAVLESVR
jgi:very-short-patch-repair endonuclease